jgi:hypothetical protein
MSMMGAILGRNVVMPWDIDAIRPMLNLLLIGPSGVGKSRSITTARLLLSFIPPERRPQFVDGGATKERLHMDIARNPHTIVFASELAAFFSKEKYKEGLIPYVTELLDYKDVTENRTKQDRDVTTIEKHEVTILGASTRDWLQTMLPDAAIGGGFLPRFLILYEGRKERKVAAPGRKIKEPQYAWVHDFRSKTFLKFQSLMVDYLRPFEIDFEDADAADTLMFWYNALQPATGLLAPFAERAREHVMRMSIILAVSCGEEFVSSEHIRSAIKLYNLTADRLGEIVTPTTATGKLLAMVMDSIPEQGIHEVEIFKALRHMYSTVEVTRALQSLVASRDVRQEERVWFRL